MVKVNTIYYPKLISVWRDAYCELVRWAFDWWGIVYDEEYYARVTSLSATRRCRTNAVPVVDNGETLLLGARDTINYYEARAPLTLRLYPSDKKLGEEAGELMDRFFSRLKPAVDALVAAQVPDFFLPKTRLITKRMPPWERVAIALSKLLYRNVWQGQQNSASTVAEQLATIDAVFDEVDSRLSKAGPFILGSEITIADLALASVTASILFPAEHPEGFPPLSQLPSTLRTLIDRWRVRPAGELVLRLYERNRPRRRFDLVSLNIHGSGKTIRDKLANSLVSPEFLRPLFALLRWGAPICVLGKRAIVTRFSDVIEVLKRDRDFTIAEVNSERIGQIDGPFILGMDKSEEYDRESTLLHQCVRLEDLDRIRGLVKGTAEEFIAAARPQKRIDVVNGLARIVPIRLVATYFGMPGTDDPSMMRWMRDVFHYIFADLTKAPTVLQDALNSGAELRGHMDKQIALRKSKEASLPRNDDVLGRLLDLQVMHSWLDDNAVRRNLSGLIVGAVDTTSHFVTLAVDELLRRPKQIASARVAALNGDIEKVRRFAWEAVRFNPHHPVQVRHCSKRTKIAEGTPRMKTLPEGALIYVATLSAMFDSAEFVEPGQFNSQRSSQYLHFGYGMHECFGRHINAVQIPELVSALLRLPNLRRARGQAGQIQYDGPFPDRLILEFDN